MQTAGTKDECINIIVRFLVVNEFICKYKCNLFAAMLQGRAQELVKTCAHIQGAHTLV